MRCGGRRSSRRGTAPASTGDRPSWTSAVDRGTRRSSWRQSWGRRDASSPWTSRVAFSMSSNLAPARPASRTSPPSMRSRSRSAAGRRCRRRVESLGALLHHPSSRPDHENRRPASARRRLRAARILRLRHMANRASVTRDRDLRPRCDDRLEGERRRAGPRASPADVLDDLGFDVQRVQPIIEAAAPSEPKWRWLAAFIESGRRRLESLGAITAADSRSIGEALARSADDARTRMFTPALLEIVAKRR